MKTRFRFARKAALPLPRESGSELIAAASLLIGSIWQRSDELDAIVLAGLLDL